jgi:hypothetical protein
MVKCRHFVTGVREEVIPAEMMRCRVQELSLDTFMYLVVFSSAFLTFSADNLLFKGELIPACDQAGQRLALRELSPLPTWSRQLTTINVVFVLQ